MELCLMTDKPTIQERYQRAANSGGDRDVLGAYGLADRRLQTGWVPTGPDGEGYSIPKAPLAVKLERLFAGDHHVAAAIVEDLAVMVWSKADFDRTKPKLSRPASVDMARAVLAWHRDGTCKHCGGHGYQLIPGTPMHSERECEHCRHGKIPLEREFIPAHRELVRWLLSEIVRESGRAAPEAMKALRERMQF